MKEPCLTPSHQAKSAKKYPEKFGHPPEKHYLCNAIPKAQVAEW